MVTLKRKEYAVEGMRGITAPSPLLLVAFLRAFRRCQGVILHLSTLVHQHPDTVRLGTSDRFTRKNDGHRLIEQRNKAPVVCPGRYQFTRLFRCTINRDGYHAPEEEVQPTHLRSGEFPSNSYRCSHFVLCWVSHRRKHWRKGLECTASSHRRRLSLRYTCSGTIAQRRSASSHREAIAAASASPCLLKSFSRSLVRSSSRHAR